MTRKQLCLFVLGHLNRAIFIDLIGIIATTTVTITNTDSIKIFEEEYERQNQPEIHNSIKRVTKITVKSFRRSSQILLVFSLTCNAV